MADASPPGTMTLEEKLSRLGRKPGVRAIIVVDRVTGAVVKQTGQVEALETSRARTVSLTSEDRAVEETPAQIAERFATMVWNYVNSTQGLVHEMSSEDELKLLRLRTKNKELVIVPDARYLLVVVHDTPAV